MKKILRTSFMIPAIIILVLLFVWALWSYLAIARIEEPSYTIEDKLGKIEVRKYAPYLVAETTVSGSMRSGLNSGFQIIANYIFGDNTKKSDIAMTAPVLEESEKIAMTVPVIEGESEKIAMTAPVVEENNEDASRTIAFVMPSEYTLESLPLPNDSRVKIRQVEERTLAVLRFAWYPTESRVEAKKQELLRLIEETDLTVVGTVQSAFYNPPLSFPLLLRNEVWVEVVQ